MSRHDRVIRAGRVVCPRTGLDGPGAIALDGHRIVAVGSELEGEVVQEFSDAILLPGFIDLHSHPGRVGTTVHAVSTHQNMLAHGVTTTLSQGDAGADTLADYLDKTHEPSGTRVFMALNLSRRGELAKGTFANPDDANIDACVAAAAAHPDFIWGIAVNISRHSCGHTDPRLIARRGIEAAEQSGLPILFGLRCPEDWPLADQLELLRPGDVVTYCYRRRPHCIVDWKTRRVLPEVRAARERGIIFDVGHGMGSFDFEVTETAIAEGLPPDTISTDFQRRHLDTQTEHSLPLVMAKLKAAGMPEADVFRAVTTRPAEILRRESDLGTIAPGASSDLVAMVNAGDREFTDVDGTTRRGSSWKVVMTSQGNG